MRMTITVDEKLVEHARGALGVRTKSETIRIDLGGIRFLISAGHVLKLLHQQELRADCGGVLAPIQGQITYVFGEQEKTSEDDPVDIRVVRLGGHEWNAVPNSAFLCRDELDHEPPIPSRHTFGLIGYPFTKQCKALKGQTVAAQVYQVLGMECPQAVYEELYIDPAASVLMGFNKKRTWGPKGMVTAPDLYGASGCGLWRFGRRIRAVSTPARLSGIGIIWERHARVKYVRGTRIRVILGAFADQYDDVQSFIAGSESGYQAEVKGNGWTSVLTIILRCRLALVFKKRVDRTTRDPDRMEEHDDGTRHFIRQIPEFGNRWLRVIVNVTVDPEKRVTAFFDRRLRRTK